MPAHYDYYDYPSYWKGREYEHSAEVIALKEMLKKIPKIKNLIEIGAGYGRLTPTYAYRARKIVLLDPSARLLKEAKENLKDYKNIVFVHSKMENIKKHYRANYFDTVILVRVLHHLEEPDKAFKIINKILKRGGYFILEYANKRHFKATARELLKGNFTFPIDIFPKDIRRPQNIKRKTIPFINYHPDEIEAFLLKNGFEIIEKDPFPTFVIVL